MGLKTFLPEDTKFFSEKVRELGSWLSQYDLTNDEIKERLPDVHHNFVDTLLRMDACFEAQDKEGFLNAIEKIRSIYLQAIELLRVRQK